ncbi:MAG: Ig-like domain-containing domain [Planctomycetota bacterium]
MVRVSADHVDVVFTRPIDPTTFTDEDVRLEGPNGPIPVTSIELVDEIATRQTYQVSLPRQATKGLYRYSIGPNITGANGLLLDQDHDGIGGEAVDDVYDNEFELDVPPRVADLRPVPGSTLDHAPSSIVAYFDEPIDPNTVSTRTFRLLGSGGDGTFNDGNEV